MAISDEITRLQTAKGNIKTSIVNKGVAVEDSAKIDTYNTLIDQIAMDTTATENDILLNKTAYINGAKVTGKAFSVQTSATADKILNGYTAYNNAGELLTGSAFSTATTATAANILSGKTAYQNDGTLLTGSMTDYSGQNNSLASSEIQISSSGTTVYYSIPEEGYYNTSSTLSSSRSRIKNKIMEAGSVTATSSSVITLGPFNFKPTYFYLILPFESALNVGGEGYITSMYCYISSTSKIGAVKYPDANYVGFVTSSIQDLWSTTTASALVGDLCYGTIEDYFTCTLGGEEGAWTLTIERPSELQHIIYFDEFDFDYIVY